MRWVLFFFKLFSKAHFDDENFIYFQADEDVQDPDLEDENDDDDREKYSGSDSDDQEEEEEVVKQETPKASPKAEVRKRKARKAEQAKEDIPSVSAGLDSTLMNYLQQWEDYLAAKDYILQKKKEKDLVGDGGKGTFVL